MNEEIKSPYEYFCIALNELKTVSRNKYKNRNATARNTVPLKK